MVFRPGALCAPWPVGREIFHAGISCFSRKRSNAFIAKGALDPSRSERAQPSKICRRLIDRPSKSSNVCSWRLILTSFPSQTPYQYKQIIDIGKRRPSENQRRVAGRDDLRSSRTSSLQSSRALRETSSFVLADDSFTQSSRSTQRKPHELGLRFGIFVRRYTIKTSATF